MTILRCLATLAKVQKNFGKSPEDLQDMTEAFDYAIPENTPLERIRWAFLEYVKFRPDMPAPCDIKNIIETGNIEGIKPKNPRV